MTRMNRLCGSSWPCIFGAAFMLSTAGASQSGAPATGPAGVPTLRAPAAEAPARLETAGLWRNEDGSVIVGVRFVMSPKWHIYWTNPGDSGMPPRFTPELPQGWSHASTIFPRPDVLKTDEGTTLGYEEHAVLLLVLKPQPAARSGPASIAVRYLVCKALCIAGEGAVRIELPAPDGIPTLAALPTIIDGRSYPQPLSSVSGRAAVNEGTLRVRGELPDGVSAAPGASPSVRVVFLPFDFQGFTVPGGMVTPGRADDGSFSIEAEVSLEPNDAPAQGLRAGGLVTFGTARHDPCIDFTVQVANPIRPK